MEILNYFVNQADIKSRLPLKTWWAMLLVLPLSVRLICFIVNRTSWSPNMITLSGLLLRLSTAVLFFLATPLTLMLGALAYIAAYVCDCTDGAVARLTGKTSELGRYLDHISDLLGDVLILLALVWSQDLIFAPWIWAMVFMQVAECYISYLNGFIIIHHEGGLDNFVLFRWFNRYRTWFFNRNIKSFFSFPDYTAFVFVLCPLLGIPAFGLQIGFYALLVICFYTILSTFVSVHTSIRQFP